MSEPNYDFPDEELMQQSISIWDCIDPCAYLCFAIQRGDLPLDDQTKKTLDAFGWLRPDGQPDYVQMTNEFRRSNENKPKPSN